MARHRGRHQQGKKSNEAVPATRDSHLFDFVAIDALLKKSYRHTWLILLALGGAFFTLSAMAMLN